MAGARGTTAPQSGAAASPHRGDGRDFLDSFTIVKNNEDQASIFSEFENKKTFGGNTRGTGVQP